MIIPALIVLCVSLYIMYYIRNRQEERRADRRERLQEKQEQLMESIRGKKEENTGDSIQHTEDRIG